MKVFLITLVITVYEIVLIMYSANTFSLSRNWFRVWDNMPVFQSNIEFVIALGQIPVICFFGWIIYRKQKAVEEDFFDKYGKK